MSKTQLLNYTHKYDIHTVSNCSTLFAHWILPIHYKLYIIWINKPKYRNTQLLVLIDMFVESIKSMWELTETSVIFFIQMKMEMPLIMSTVTRPSNFANLRCIGMTTSVVFNRVRWSPENYSIGLLYFRRLGNYVWSRKLTPLH